MKGEMKMALWVMLGTFFGALAGTMAGEVVTFLVYIVINLLRM